MEEPREVAVSLTDRFLTLDLPTEDERLIASVLIGLGQYIKKGSSIKLKLSYLTFSGTQELSTKVISNNQQIGDWGKEIKGLISALRRR